MGSELIIPQAELVPCRRARLWRDHRPRPVERHHRDLRRVGISEGRARSSARASSRPAPSSTARPRRSRSRSTASTTRVSHLRRLKASGAWSVKSYNQPRREQRQMIIEAARQLRHGSGAGRRLAVRDEHDDDRRRPHDDRAFAAGRQHLRRRAAVLEGLAAPPTRRPWSWPMAGRSARITGTSTPMSGRSRSCRAGCRGRCSTPARAGR